MNPQEFESRRIALFANCGARGTQGIRLPAGEGRETYALSLGGDDTRSDCPTVLVHGGIGQAGDWCLLAGKLHGRVIVPDRPGCGLSYPMDYTGVDYRSDAAAWLRSVADGLGAEKINLVGNSMGGYFSIAFALAHPERVRNLILVGAPAGLDRWVPFFLRLLGIPGIGPFIIGRVMSGPVDPEVLRRRVFSNLVAHPERVPTESLRVGAASQAFPASQRCVHTMLRTALDLGGFRAELMVREALAALPVRTLFLWGAADKYAPVESGQKVAERMPDARFITVEDAGHMPHYDACEILAQHINDFLQTDRRPTRPVTSASSLAQNG